MRTLRIVLVGFTVIILQASLVSRLTIDGARADLVLLTAVGAGVAAGPELGAIVGFGTGLGFDVLLPTPLGMSALCYCLTGYAAGLLHGLVLQSGRWVLAVMVAVLSAGGTLLVYVVCAVLGQPHPPLSHLPVIVAVVSLVNAVLAVPMVGLCRWALTESSAARFRRESLPLR